MNHKEKADRLLSTFTKLIVYGWDTPDILSEVVCMEFIDNGTPKQKKDWAMVLEEVRCKYFDINKD